MASTFFDMAIECRDKTIDVVMINVERSN